MIVIYYGLGAQKLQNTFLGRLHFHSQELFILTPVDRKHPVPGHLADGLLILIVHLVNTLRLLVLGGSYKLSFLHGHIADIDAVIRLVGNLFRDNVFRPLQRLSRCFHGFRLILVLMDVFLRLGFNGFRGLLGKNKRCERF